MLYFFTVLRAVAFRIKHDRQTEEEQYRCQDWYADTARDILDSL